VRVYTLHEDKQPFQTDQCLGMAAGPTSLTPIILLQMTTKTQDQTMI